MAKLVFIALCHEQDFAAKIRVLFDKSLANHRKNEIELRIIREVDSFEGVINKIRNPNKLEGGKIPLTPKIIAVANINESLLSSNFKRILQKTGLKPDLIQTYLQEGTAGFSFYPFKGERNENLEEIWTRFFNEKTEEFLPETISQRSQRENPSTKAAVTQPV